MSTINVTSAPKTATFQMRINPEVKQRMEEIYARQGLSFQPGEGLVMENVEKTIESVGRMGREGMRSTDVEILNIMLGK